MGKIKEMKGSIRRMSKLWRSESIRTPLLEKNNNVQEGNAQDVNENDDPLDQNNLNTHTEQLLQPQQEMTLQELAEVLEVQLDATSIYSVDESCCSRPQQKLKSGVVQLIQTSASQHFPEPPVDLNQNPQEHLVNMKNVVLNELLRLSPLLEPQFMGCVMDSYHCQIIGRLLVLLQNICSSRNCLALIQWCLKTYLSQELICHPDLQEMDPINKIDLLLLIEWGEKAKGKLLEIVQEEVKLHLEKILQNERDKTVCDSEEDFVELYIDTIKCIDAMPTEAENISFKLSDDIQEVCFQQLLIFVTGYKEEQTKTLTAIAKMDKPETIYFIKTLETCGKLKQYIQTKDKGARSSLLKENVQILQDIEDFTLNLLVDIVTDITKKHLKHYFTADKKQFFSLMHDVKTISPNLYISQHVKEKVMDEVYKIIIHIYINNLLKYSLRKLKKCWSLNAEQKITEDAVLLYETISQLAPGVQIRNQKLLTITEVLECSGVDGLKLTLANSQKESPTESEDLEFLQKLLRWKGLSKRDITEVLDTVRLFTCQPKSKPRSDSWFSCFI